MTARRDSNTDRVRTITADATEFGLHMKQGGWRLGLLVARNVAVSPGRVSPESLLPKVNATEFARRAGTSNDRVIRHYAAWERAATAGLVPHAADLTPGSDVDLDVERLPAWGPIYSAPIERRTTTPRATPRAPEPVTTRTADPVLPPVHIVDADDAQTSRALEAARQNLGQALDEIRDPDHDGEVAADARDNEWTEDVRYAVNAIMGHTRRLFDAARDDEWANTNARQQAADELRGLARQLTTIADLAISPDKGRITDADLAALLTT